MVISLAKGNEEVFIAGQSQPVNTAYDIDSAVMRLLRQLRDEAHRHAVSNHRMSRSKNAFINST